MMSNHTIGVVLPSRCLGTAFHGFRKGKRLRPLTGRLLQRTRTILPGQCCSVLCHGVDSGWRLAFSPGAIALSPRSV
jgi:hypothetical protein